MRRGLALGVLLSWSGVDFAARADAASDAGAGPDAAAGASVTGCVESIPKGADRPLVLESFPQRATSGWASTLSLTIKHGKGERVLPAGLDLANATEMKKVLADAGFAVPEQGATAGAQLWTEPEDKQRSLAVTHLDLPLLVLPKKAGRSRLELPPLPIAVARSNGELATVCTTPHVVVVDDPTADVPEATPRPNPPPRPQVEEWTAMKKAVQYGGLGLLAGAAIAYVAYRVLTKPKPPAPPPPPRPPWELALERLDEVRHAGLLDAGRHGEYFDRVSDAVRGYLGARFGFDGLESTTDEILGALRRQAGGFVQIEPGPDGAPLPGIPLSEISAFLRECDLVKFANLTPTEDQCATALVVGERIVRQTMPVARAATSAPAAAGARADDPRAPDGGAT